MSKKKSKPGKAQAGHGETAGKAFRPGDLPEEGSQVPTPEEGAVPLGLPISAEEYKDLQERNRHRALPPPGSAQEDPSA
jgi:hypothetical protein